ncbi:outer membrane lipoprotein omp19 [Roseibium aquae]|uniref:Outer membrane lipoprotein omp19 n=1 Tax=Roseibium aquae TaxID=1323746 RepID=A0A916X1E8_9HYPH|nr:protease inhibitor Inh/omp19 family protein [Roseibium aquae]GGB47565.1 outer membrane lipoprotein omp19 [Roseibium aquae]
MKAFFKVALVIGVVATVAGCQRLSGNRNYATPLPAAPTTPIGEATLQPLDPNAPPPGTVLDPQASPQGTEFASAAPVAEPVDAVAVDRSDMLGGWKLASGGDNCMAFMTLTTWAGGYRANTRGCSSPVLSGISAWDLQGKQVILKDNNGGVVAQLYAGAGGRFNGQTAAGAPVSLFR